MSYFAFNWPVFGAKPNGKKKERPFRSNPNRKKLKLS
jgi:hypothetical protein